MMNTLLIRDSFEGEDMARLRKEFPQFKIITLDEGETVHKLGMEACSQIEIMYGCALSEAELNFLPQLHWIHCDSPYLDDLCMDAIRKLGSVLITTTKEENLIQVGEFAIGAALAFSKKLFDWEIESRNPEHIDLLELRKQMWKIQGKIFLQIGLGTIGKEISRRAKMEGFRVWGMQKIASFHPECEKCLTPDRLPEALPQADIVCLAMPREEPGPSWFDKEKFSLMKNDSVLLVFGSGSAVNLDDLAEAEKKGKFRGILLDAHFSPPIPKNYPLWNRPYVIVTNESSIYPTTFEHRSFNTFLYNLRQYLHGNFSDMKNLIKTKSV